MSSAADYYRVRIVRLDEPEDVEFDWNREIINSGRPAESFVDADYDGETLWRVDVMNQSDGTCARTFTNIASRDKAEQLEKTLNDDLKLLSRESFKSQYAIL